MTEQELINSFIGSTKFTSEFKNVSIINNRCKSKNYADIEFTCNIKKGGNQLWRIEAKVHTNGDRHNTVHKIFGELLKETGRIAPQNTEVKYGILISDFEFYSRKYSIIDKRKFIAFGELIPVSLVIVWRQGSFYFMNWNDLHT